jgi:hypothetical protein
VSYLYENSLTRANTSFHYSIKPFLLSDLNEVIDIDSIQSTVIPKFLKLDNIGKGKQRRNTIHGGLLFEFAPGGIIGTGLANKSTFVSSIGGTITSTFGEKVALSISYISGNSRFPSYVDSVIAASEVVPGNGYAHKTSLGYAHDDFQGYLSFAPFSFFNVQVGKGKHFFGNGYRSLLLSDNASSYPYIRLSTRLWRFKYINLYTAFNDARGFNGVSSNYQKKYGAFHYLSWNVTKWLNFNLFEGIIWRGTDSSGVRGFDINYMNPVVFYRPVEFAQGSPDNALMGFGLKLQPFKNQELYAQLILDEFLFSEVISGKGWWGNKQGFQAGLKSYDLFGVSGLTFLSEYNYVRPYTYSHGISHQNYSHYNQALAHPLGANFFESVSLIRLQKKSFIGELQFNYIEQGVDSMGSNWGGDIFLDYLTPRERDYGNVVGQGVEIKTVISGLRLAYILIPSLNLMAETQIALRTSVSNNVRNNTCIFSIGLRTAIGNRYHDF